VEKTRRETSDPPALAEIVLLADAKSGRFEDPMGRIGWFARALGATAPLG